MLNYVGPTSSAEVTNEQGDLFGMWAMNWNGSTTYVWMTQGLLYVMTNLSLKWSLKVFTAEGITLEMFLKHLKNWNNIKVGTIFSIKTD